MLTNALLALVGVELACVIRYLVVVKLLLAGGCP